MEGVGTYLTPWSKKLPIMEVPSNGGIKSRSKRKLDLDRKGSSYRYRPDLSSAADTHQVLEV